MAVLWRRTLLMCWGAGATRPRARLVCGRSEGCRARADVVMRATRSEGMLRGAGEDALVKMRRGPAVGVLLRTVPSLCGGEKSFPPEPRKPKGGQRWAPEICCKVRSSVHNAWEVEVPGNMDRS